MNEIPGIGELTDTEMELRQAIARKIPKSDRRDNVLLMVSKAFRLYRTLAEAQNEVNRRKKAWRRTTV